jgi:hypothetical protein
LVELGKKLLFFSWTTPTFFNKKINIFGVIRATTPVVPLEIGQMTAANKPLTKMGIFN